MDWYGGFKLSLASKAWLAENVPAYARGTELMRIIGEKMGNLETGMADVGDMDTALALAADYKEIQTLLGELETCRKEVYVAVKGMLGTLEDAAERYETPEGEEPA